MNKTPPSAPLRKDDPGVQAILEADHDSQKKCMKELKKTLTVPLNGTKICPIEG